MLQSKVVWMALNGRVDETRDCGDLKKKERGYVNTGENTQYKGISSEYRGWSPWATFAELSSYICSIIIDV